MEPISIGQYHSVRISRVIFIVTLLLSNTYISRQWNFSVFDSSFEEDIILDVLPKSRS